MKITAFSQPTTELIKYVLENILSGTEVETFEILAIDILPKTYENKITFKFRANGIKHQLVNYTSLITDADREEDESTVLKCLELFGSEIADFCR